MKHEPVLTRRAFLGLSVQKQDDSKRPFVYHTEHDGDIVFEPTTARSSQPVVTSKQSTNFSKT